MFPRAVQASSQLDLLNCTVTWWFSRDVSSLEYRKILYWKSRNSWASWLGACGGFWKTSSNHSFWPSEFSFSCNLNDRVIFQKWDIKMDNVEFGCCGCVSWFIILMGNMNEDPGTLLNNGMRSQGPKSSCLFLYFYIFFSSFQINPIKC